MCIIHSILKYPLALSMFLAVLAILVNAYSGLPQAEASVKGLSSTAEESVYRLSDTDVGRFGEPEEGHE